MSWLKQLEEKIEAAATEIVQLRKQNRSLKARVKRLEKAAADSASEQGAAWVEEREKVRARVTALAGGLEDALR